MRIYTRAKILALLLIIMTPASSMAIAANDDFSRFPADSRYTGKPKLPDFNGRDKTYRSMRSRITAGVHAGVNYAGKYVIIDVGCGTGCHAPFFVDASTGQVLNFPLGGEDNIYLSMKYRADSNLLIAQWQNDNDECVQEAMIWTGSEFKRSGPKKVDAGVACQAPIQ